MVKGNIVCLRSNLRFMRLAIFAAVFLISSSLFALAVPALKGRVDDYANIIRESDEKEITEYLYNLEQNFGIQLAVLTVPSLDGDDIASFGFRVSDNWKLGTQEKDNGAILIVALKEHDVRIEVGDGLEGSLTDAKCGLILRNVVIPEFKNGNYSAGIKKGIMNMGGIASGDESAVSKSVRKDDSKSSDSGVVPIYINAIWMIFFFSTISAGTRRGRKRGRYYHNGNAMSWIAADAALRSMSRGFGSGSGSGSSHSSSGGFGGFSGGGGHFSGGGASAHW